MLSPGFVFKLFNKTHTEEVLLLKFTHLFSSIYRTEDKCSHNWAIKGGVEMLLIVKGN